MHSQAARLRFLRSESRSQKTQPTIGNACPTAEDDLAADQDLIDVRRAQAGDLGAFEGIVRRWQTPLVGLAYRFVRDRGRAEDMAQEAFLRVFRELAGFRRESAFSTWLFAVALNVYRSELRRHGAPHVPLDAIAQLASQQPPQLALESTERDDLVRRAVSSLPSRYRDALTVFYFKEMDLAETARILQVPPGTAKAWLHRGRELLRRKLGDAQRAGPMSREVHT
jgi:RNA polymerase sigma-70 factor (ECF subfamily)